jgi:hypothetical protein
MNSKKAKQLAAGLVILILALLWFLFPRPILVSPEMAKIDPLTSHQPAEATTVPAEEDSARRKVAEIVGSMLNTPIVFYGKVVDQNGDPVPEANVDYGLLDKFNESGSVGKTRADGGGNVKISGVRGAVISVSVYKKGYHFIEDLSKGSFAYGYGNDAYTKSPPTRENPAVLVLHKMVVTEPLIRLENPSFRLKKDGTPMKVNLATGKVSNSGQLQVQAWTAERPPDGTKRFDWKYRISVPGGGVIERANPFDFEAPEKGYHNFLEFEMPANVERWIPGIEKSYFLRLADGRYARIEFRMVAQGYHYFRIDSLLNPKSGSRNLEFDPKSKP